MFRARGPPVYQGPLAQSPPGWGQSYPEPRGQAFYQDTYPQGQGPLPADYIYQVPGAMFSLPTTDRTPRRTRQVSSSTASSTPRLRYGALCDTLVLPAVPGAVRPLPRTAVPGPVSATTAGTADIVSLANTVFLASGPRRPHHHHHNHRNNNRQLDPEVPATDRPDDHHHHTEPRGEV